MEPDELILLGGVNKNHVLEVLKPHVFFDDQRQHLEKSLRVVPSIHIPFGVTNESALQLAAE
jgi:5'-nucleotidase